MNRSIAIALAISIAYLVALPPRADAARLNASVFPIKFNCAAFGDDFCAGGQVLNDPALAGNFASNLNATGSSLLVADFSYVDPRIGTANSTSGRVMAGLGVLRAIAGSSVSSSPPLTSGSPNLTRLGTFSTATFADTITIMPGTAALIGTAGTMTASFLVDGNLDATGVNGKAGTSASMASAAWRMQVYGGQQCLRIDLELREWLFRFRVRERQRSRYKLRTR